MNDQATHLRRLVRIAEPPGSTAPRRAVEPRGLRPRPEPRPEPRTGTRIAHTPGSQTQIPDLRPTSPQPVNAALAQAIAVTSGKGGVGKTNIAVNLAVRLARLGRRVCLLDADLGLANADVLCSITPRLTLEHVVGGQCRLAEAMLLAPGGFRLIPGACGASRLADLNRVDRGELLRQLAALDRVADVLIIDTAAGLSANVLGFVAAARRALVVTTPEPTAMTDAYGIIKALAARAPQVRLDVLVNMVRSDAEGRSVFERVNRVTRTFLGRTLEYAGSVPMDAAVREAVQHRMPFALYAPDCPATAEVDRLARRVAGLDAADRGPDAGFFARLSTWFSGERLS